MMADMTRHVRTTIRFDGPALVGHEMDVQDLAPALIALAELIQLANRKFNGDVANIKVLVDADAKQKCFQLDLSLVQSFFDQAATFLGQKDIVTAKEIGEWLGLIGPGGGTLFGVYKFFSRTKPGKGDVVFTAGDVAGTTIITIIGNGNSITVPDQVALLASDPEIARRVKNVVRPLERTGYEDLTFLHNDQAITSIDKFEAAEIIAAPENIVLEVGDASASEIRGLVRIKSPQYEGTARWSLLWAGRAISAEMADKVWVAAFQSNRVSAPPNSVLEVTMTETVRLDDGGQAVSSPTYVVTTVHSVKIPPVQTTFDYGNQPADDAS